MLWTKLPFTKIIPAVVDFLVDFSSPQLLSEKTSMVMRDLSRRRSGSTISDSFHLSKTVS